uniref:Uncharacterized protein n=1 Tax=Vitis vinifera TaxID=29760 RepID=A5CA32_VITVI|nr:hypothetical protein VITISV_008924 [Vitis vinifera]
MARTRGAKSAFPFGRKRVAREAPVQGSTSEPPRQVATPPPAEPAPLSHPARRYQTRSGGRPPQKRAKVRDPTLIHFTIDECHGILGARHIAEALHIPYEPASLEDYRVWTNPPQLEMVHILSRGTSINPYLLRKELPPSMFFIDALLRHNIYPLQHWVQRRGVLLEALFRVSKGYFFGPHHLIMAALLYFEEKVHRKKLLRADAIPLLFPRFLCQILEHLGYSSDPQLERKRICREPKDAQPADIPTARRASTEPIHEGIPSAFPATHSTPPVIPAALEPSTSAEPRITIPLSEYRDLCHTFQTLTATQSSLAQEMSAIRAHQEQILTTQTQHTAILRQLQHHLGLPSAIEHLAPTTTEPHAPPEPATEDAEIST